MKTIECIRYDFSFMDDWNDRYRYLIELGQELDEFPENLRNQENKVRGCVSNVWIITKNQQGKDPVLIFSGISDSHIVSGLISIALAIFSNKRVSEILQIDAEMIFKELGLDEHLTMQRSNGLHALVDRIKNDAIRVSEQCL